MSMNGGADVNRLFIGAGCNRIVNNVSWGACDLVAFGAQNAVAIFCPKVFPKLSPCLIELTPLAHYIHISSPPPLPFWQTAQILTTLPGHKAAVNCTQWLPNNKFAFKAKQLERHYLLSGDADGIIILWELSLHDGKWRNVLQVPKSHKKGVTCITGILVSQTEAIFASTSSDGAVCVWEMLFPSTSGEDCKLFCVESLSIGSKPMVALSLAELPGNTGHIVLAMGGLDNRIHIYCGERMGKLCYKYEDMHYWNFGFLRLSLDEDCKLFCVESLSIGSKPMVALSLAELPGNTGHIVLAMGGLDNRIHIYCGERMGKDKGIRIWKLALRSSLGSTQGACRKEEISLASYIEGPVLLAGSISYQISLESLLIGHEDWVYSVEWQPPSTSSLHGSDCYQPQSILSASMDKTMMIWQPEKTSGIWMNVVTVGELSHCALGFYGGHWSPNGDSILAHGYGGSFHLWKNVGVNLDNWQPQKVPSGHFAAVSDMAWARSGEYILSVSHDQTTRIFSSWQNEASFRDTNSWHEIARPQVHGHDINCVTIIQGKGNHRFISGADEKVARVFEAPLSFLKTLSHANSQNSSFSEDLQLDVQVLGANMSALGLSQKPIYVHATHETSDRTGNDGLDTFETIPDAVPAVFTQPPIEDQLAWHTLWPESHKLYGHGNELFSLCCDHEGKLVASSCKAQSAMVAEIWLWQVGSWKAVGQLQSHSLTVTQMEFSHDDNMLLAVSRDRQFSVFSIKRTGIDEISYQLVARQEAHKRIIWSCSWNPYGHEFATGSRDKTVKVWGVDEGSSVRHLLTLPQFNSSVTAISWTGLGPQRNDGFLAVGMESGLIELWSLSVKRVDDGGISAAGVAAALVRRLDPLMCHVSAVNRLAWRSPKSEDCKNMQLASCGADNCVRVFDIAIN
ncbi:Elongator complex protein 2 [Morella rubra]|uniref:Elongator complex protein 2 n=1 Tax=Morella rubra TaxID=262757 RepID=A0A6A1V2Y5_9ROSI|nr:Elongator complex protein 2 [Morella rubra]